MSAAISPRTGKRYGAKRVCEAFDVPRSSFYDRKARRNRVGKPLKRGPKTPVSDEALLELIRADLASSLFIGEGHRKVWGRLRFVQGIKVGRRRVLRVMREHTFCPLIGFAKPRLGNTMARSSPLLPMSCGALMVPRSSPLKMAGVGCLP